MNFFASTHKQRWLFTKEQLVEIRQQTNEAGISIAIERCKRPRPSPEPDGEQGDEEDTPDTSAGPAPVAAAALPGAITPEDERKLLRFFAGEILKLCNQLHYPTKVKATAVMYLKRFFLRHSCITYRPVILMLTCIYLAGKIEEAYIGAEDFCSLVQTDIKQVLNHEITLLQGLNFDLIVHSPYRALVGLIEDIRACRDRGAGSHVDPALLNAAPEALEQWKAAAMSSVDALMLSDAPLRHPPGQLALAALRNALKSHGIKIVAYLEHAAQQAKEALAAQGQEPPGGDVLSCLHAALDDIDRLGMEGAQKVDKEDVQAIDARLLTMRSQADPEAAKAAALAAEKEKAERREAKLKARREAKAEKEALLLGMPQRPSNPG